MPFDSCRDEILAQLERILASKDFCQAPSLSKLLRFVVVQTLAGNASDLKEVTIGVDVYGHRPDDGSLKTPVVRVNASRVRKRLTAYYETVGREDPWIIALSGEGYVPQMMARAGPLAEPSVPHLPPAGRPAGSRWKTASMICTAVFLLMTAALVAWAYPIRPPVVIAFTQLTTTGHLKDGPLLTDGSRVYFEDRIEGVAVPVSVPVGGGAVTRLEIPLIQAPVLLDYQREGRRFLVHDNALSAKVALWEWTPGAPPKPVTSADLARWVPEALLKRVGAGKDANVGFEVEQIGRAHV